MSEVNVENQKNNCVDAEYVKIYKRDLDRIFGHHDINEVLALLVESEYQNQYPEMKDKKYILWNKDELIYAYDRMIEIYYKETHKEEDGE